MKYDKITKMLKINKLLLVFVALLFLLNYPNFVFAATDNPGTLKITKSNGAKASEGTDVVTNDYYWEYDLGNNLHKLYITSENLTVSGTDNSNNVWIVFDRHHMNDENDDACASLTFNNLNLEGNVSFVVNQLGTTLTIKGNNSITNNVENTNTFSTNSEIKTIGNGNLTINSLGDNSSGIYNTDEDNDIVFDLYGELNINSTCYGVFSSGGIFITNNTKKVTIRAGDGSSTFPLFGSCGIDAGSDIKIFGSSDINADEADMLGANIKHYGEPQVIAIDGDVTTYPCSVVFKPEDTSKTISFNLMGHGSAIDPIRVEVGEKIVKPEDPVEEGHVFSGWCKEIGCISEWDFKNDIVTGSMTLYAKWNFEMISDPNQSINIDESDDNLTFVSSADFDKLYGVFIDYSNTLQRDVDYIVEPGSTKVTLLSSYLKTLSEGTHIIEIGSKTNFDEDGNFDVETAIDSFKIIKNKPKKSVHKHTVPNTGIGARTFE